MIPGSATPFLLAKSDAGYQISRSLRFNDGDSPSLSRNFSSAGNRKKWTWSGWFKVASTSQPGRLFSAGADATNRTNIFYYPRSNNLGIGFYSYVGGALVGQAGTTAVLADHSAWYHLVFAFDAANSTTADRLKIYINGVEQAISYTVNVSDIDHLVSNNIAHYVGRGADGYSFDGYLAEVHFIDGQALAATDFGEYDDNNVWQPKEYSGQYNEPIDQSQNWTNLVTFNAGTWNGNGTNPFNADPTDYDYGDTTRENNGYATLDLSSFSGAKVISVTAEQTELTLTHDGGTTVYTPPNTSRTTHTFASVDNPTSLKFDGLNSNSQFVLVGVSVDGKRLVNSNITVANNGFHLDFSDNSSNAALGYDANGTVRYYPDVTGTGISSTVKKLFDGNIATTVDGTAGTVITFTPSTSIAYSSSVEVYTASSQTTRTYSLNGGTGVTNVANGWTSLATGSGTITSISQTPNSGYTHSWSAIRVDGVFLTDPNDWTVNNLAAAAPVPVYSSTHGSNITSSELAKLLDGDDSTYATASGDLIGFSYSGNSITMKVGNTDTNNPELSFIIQPFVNNIQTQSGTWSNVSVGSVASNTNFWNIPGNSTGTGTFTFPATWDGNFRIYLGGWSSAFRMYSLDTAPAEGAGIDSLIDTPTNYEAASGNNGGNYATLNPLLKPSGATLSDGNLEFTSSSNYQTGLSTIGMSSGKWYFEASISVFGTDAIIGIVSDLHFGPDYFPGSSSSPNSYGYEAAVPYLYPTNTSGYSTYTTGDIIGVAYDADNGKIYFAKNGVWGNSSDPVNGTNPGFTGITGGPHFFAVSAGTNGKWVTNFGQRPFAYTPPTGYVSLCTQNLTDPTIADGSTAMDIVTYTGTNASKTITGLNFSPDFIWTKSRSRIDSQGLHDIVRGRASNLYSDLSAAENTSSASADLVSFDSNGYTLGTVEQTAMNRSGETYVAWAWDAGSSNTSVSVGGLNSSVYNQSHAITSNITGNLPASGNPLANWFNGQRANKMEPSGSGSLDFSSVSALQNFSGTLQFAVSAYQGSTSMKFVINASSDNLTFTTEALPSSSGGFPSQLLTIPVTSLSTLDFTSISGQSTQFWGMYLDGKLLVDSTATPDNVPSIASTVRANPSAGFSIVTWTGNSGTVAHGLNAAPGLIISKIRNTSSAWPVQHSYDTSQFLTLNSTDAASSDTTRFGAAPTSSVFSVGSWWNSSSNGVAYCFAPVEGYSKFGSYTGNSSADGPFVYTGFRPRFLLIKTTANISGNWYVLDTKRDPHNVMALDLYANDSAAESTVTTNQLDILSNGFKLRGTGGGMNGSSHTLIYAAFAEHPFKTARAR